MTFSRRGSSESFIYYGDLTNSRIMHVTTDIIQITAVMKEIIPFAVFKEQHPLTFSLHRTSGKTVLPTFLTGLAIANNSMYFRMGATKAKTYIPYLV